MISEICSLQKATNFLSFFIFYFLFFIFLLSTNISFYYFRSVWLILIFLTDSYSSNFYYNVLYMPNVQQYFISFKFIIQNFYSFKEIVIKIIKTHHKITIFLTKIKMKPYRLCFDINSNFYFQNNWESYEWFFVNMHGN